MYPADNTRMGYVTGRYTEVTSTWGFSWLCLLVDAKRLSRALAVKSNGKHQEFAEQVRELLSMLKGISLSCMAAFARFMHITLQQISICIHASLSAARAAPPLHTALQVGVSVTLCLNCVGSMGPRCHSW